MYQGNYFQVLQRGQYAELVFNSQNNSLNILTKEAIEDLELATKLIRESSIAGLIIRSAKAIFSGGADVKAFRSMFSEGTTRNYLAWVQSVYNSVEDLNIPKVTIVNGLAAGGGMELTLLSEFRLATVDAKFMLPEVKYGIMPAWGGMTRTPRIAGLDTAFKWLTTGKTFRPAQALTDHVIDGIVDPAKTDPIVKAETILNACLSGEFDWQARRNEKLNPLTLSEEEVTMAMNVAGAAIAKAAGKHYPPAPLMMKNYREAIKSDRNTALDFELDVIDECIASGISDALVSVLINDLDVKGKAKAIAKGTNKSANLGVIGAGIMGGGIAYASADRGINVAMKDINDAGIELGLAEANKLLSKQVEKGRQKPNQMGEILNRIRPTLYNESLATTDLVIEAVVENPMVKHNVLAEIEKVAPNAVIASNTSTLSISGLAEAMEKPENFCGIHFFNPVHIMPLVEIIRGEKTSDETIAKAVSYALQLGKTPVVVNDCAGFLVNRVLMPYLIAFNQLLLDGADLATVDKIMSKEFGFPMGPGHLLDIVGLDTVVHCLDTMATAFPDRMAKSEHSIVHLLAASGKLGKKTGQGFYEHTVDRRGRSKIAINEVTQELIRSAASESKEFSKDEIINRLMVPMLLEVIRCLDEGIVATPGEADIAVINGIGFPPFRGGLFFYADQLGSKKLAALAEEYKGLNGVYEASDGLIKRAQKNQPFYA